ncbi:hypothetical protein [Streptomyces roseicoloratus]|uniref:Uncharacterized protein n=1 Tax=Streptomyces roseicoloratus TaxID=2508722 RepID=A0ABY9RUA3_9ACTN|nr:hypothetical protein [Streptomyces roseicoloratus]WMX45762.1 hypothetical protein RGF97_14095 [Streptomyces roseicoloratus]
MSAQQNTGPRNTVRRFALALVACLAVAGGAAAAVGGAEAPATHQQPAFADDVNWPVPTPAPGN